MPAPESGEIPPTQETPRRLETIINEAFNTLQHQIEAERQRLLALVTGGEVLKASPQPPEGTPIPPDIQAIMTEVQARLQSRKVARMNPDIKALNPSPKAIRLLGEIVKDLAMLWNINKAGHLRGRKELSILAVLAEKADTGEPVSVTDVQTATGYKETKLKSELTRRLNYLLQTTPWRVVGNDQTGWRLVNMGR